LGAERPPENIQWRSFTFVRGSWHSKNDTKSTDLYSIVSSFSLWGLVFSFGGLSPKSYPMVTGQVERFIFRFRV